MHFLLTGNVLIIFIDQMQNTVESVLCFPGGSNGGSKEEANPSFHIVEHSGILQRRIILTAMCFKIIADIEAGLPKNILSEKV